MQLECLALWEVNLVGHVHSMLVLLLLKSKTHFPTVFYRRPKNNSQGLISLQPQNEYQVV